MKKKRKHPMPQGGWAVLGKPWPRGKRLWTKERDEQGHGRLTQSCTRPLAAAWRGNGEGSTMKKKKKRAPQSAPERPKGCLSVAVPQYGVKPRHGRCSSAAISFVVAVDPRTLPSGGWRSGGGEKGAPAKMSRMSRVARCPEDRPAPRHQLPLPRSFGTACPRPFRTRLPSGEGSETEARLG